MARSLREAVLLALLGACIALSSCNREKRPLQAPPETGPRGVVVTDLFPGTPRPTPADPRVKTYAGNAFHIMQGQQYFRWFNCNGCHANGGGGMGPPLMDARWRYGGSMEQIYSTIVQGRPNGMPAFKDKIPDQQVWQIAAYIESLSGNADKLAAPSRMDGMRSIPPINNIDRQPPAGGDDTPVRGGA